MYKNFKLSKALEYGNRGWHVLPLHSAWKTKDLKKVRCSCAKGYNCKNMGKHPRLYNGVKGATTDLNAINEWWKEWPLANIGVATGSVSGFWVIDIDLKKGKNGWESLVKQYGDDLDIDKQTELLQQTASGSFHVLVYSDENIIPMNKVGVFSGIDVRSNGGYIVVSPSTIGDSDYKWNNIELEPAEFKKWSLDIALRSLKQDETPVDKTHSGIDLESIYQAGIPEGTRDDTLFRVANKLRITGVPYDIARFVMIRMAEKCEPFDTEVQDKVIHKLDYAYTFNKPKSKEERKKFMENIDTSTELSVLISKMKGD